MATIESIELNLIEYSYQMDWSNFIKTVNSITSPQILDISSQVKAQTLSNILIADKEFDTADDAQIATAVRYFMAKLGQSLDVTPIADAISTFAYRGNFAALDASTDYLTDAQKFDLAQTHIVQNALFEIALNDNPYTTDEDASVAKAMRDFSSKFVSEMNDVYYLAGTISTLARNGNFAALDAVTDYLTDAQKFDLAQNYEVKNALFELSYHDQWYTTEDDAAVAKAVRDFASKFESNMQNISPVANVMETFSRNGNWEALDAVTDYLTDTQKFDLAQMNLVQMTLTNIANHDQWYTTEDDAAIADVVRNFASKFESKMTDIFPIADVIEAFAHNGNFAALDAATDYLTTTQKFDLAQTAQVRGAFVSLVNHDQWYTTEDDALIGSAVRDFASKFESKMTDTLQIFEALENADHTGNLYIEAAIFDNMSSTQFSNLPQNGNSWMENSTFGTFSSNNISGTTGADKVHGLGGNDTINGLDGDDILFGDAGNDILIGGLGDDILIGGIGADKLTGGENSDTFILDALGKGVDTITDFNSSEGDILDLSAILTDFDNITDAISAFVQTRISGENTVISVDIDGAANGSRFVDVAVLQNVMDVNVNDLHNSGQLLA